MKEFDLTKLEVASKYVERMADGRNPVNNNPLNADDVLNNPNIIRCMYFIRDVLEEVRSNRGIVGGRRGKEPFVPLSPEILDAFTYREDKSIAHVLRQIYEPAEGMNIKKIAAVKITAALKEEGYLVEEPDPESGKLRKVPGEQGKKLGIYMIDREYNGRTYQTVTYGRQAQMHIVELIRKMSRDSE